jgi:hypothetical protein
MSWAQRLVSAATPLTICPLGDLGRLWLEMFAVKTVVVEVVVSDR